MSFPASGLPLPSALTTKYGGEYYAVAKSNLVIVESPAKAKTIGKYLGPGYEVKASMGHVRDLPKSKLGVDVEHGFELNYQPIKGKEEVIDELKKSAKKSEKVFLATDPDREGEAISWHLKEMLGIPDDKTYRVTFNEITKKVVNDSIAHPRAIDMDLVNAQQARRVLDRIVGYQISPLLWKKIRRGLSAGRVQSVATRLVCEREADIKAFVPQEYWSLDADLSRIAPQPGAVQGQLLRPGEEGGAEQRGGGQRRHGGGEERPLRRHRRQAAGQAAQPLRPPLHHLHPPAGGQPQAQHDPRRTMSIAQQLYEGVDIEGGGHRGSHHLYAYRLPPPVRRGHRRREGLHPRPLRSGLLPRQGPCVQDQIRRPGRPRGHPALQRPPPTGTRRGGPRRAEHKLFNSSRERSLACQMAPAVYDSVSIEVASADTPSGPPTPPSSSPATPPCTWRGRTRRRRRSSPPPCPI